MMKKAIQKIGDKVLEGGILNMEEVFPLLETKGPDIIELAAVANRVRVEFNGNILISALSSMPNQDDALRIAPSVPSRLIIKLRPLLTLS